MFNERKNAFDLCPRLAQMWLCDQYSRQKYLTATYHYMRQSGRPDSEKFLPDTVRGSFRKLLKLRQDAMRLVARFGNPTLFITGTTNPKWPEFAHALPPGFSVFDRPCDTCRIFKLRLKRFLRIMKSGELFSGFGETYLLYRRR